MWLLSYHVLCHANLTNFEDSPPPPCHAFVTIPKVFWHARPDTPKPPDILYDIILWMTSNLSLEISQWCWKSSSQTVTSHSAMSSYICHTLTCFSQLYRSLVPPKCNLLVTKSLIKFAIYLGLRSSSQVSSNCELKCENDDQAEYLWIDSSRFWCMYYSLFYTFGVTLADYDLFVKWKGDKQIMC